MAADVNAIMRCWEDLKSLRMKREGEWQDIADYFMPRKGFSVAAVPTELGRRRVTSSLGPRSLLRGSYLLTAYLIGVTQPFVGPNVDRGMIAAGRSLDKDADAIDYLDTLQWAMFDRMMLPQSNFYQSVSRAVHEVLGFGTGVMWTGRKRGFGPRYQARPLRSCWFAENDDGEVDTLYFRWTLPAWRVLERYPDAKNVEKIAELAADEKRCQEPVTLLHVVEPRHGGRSGAVATQMPFKSVTLAPDHKAVLEETGYESFPYSVGRINLEEGSAYGTGLAWTALPDVKVYNALQQGVELAVALRNYPPLFKPARMFGKPVDRRPGAMNSYDQAGLGFQNARDAIQRLDIAGDPTISANYMASLKGEVEQIFFIDWMNLNDGVQKTAEEIRDRRDLRVRAMSSLAPALDRELIGVAAARTLEAMQEEGLLPPPPASLSGVDVDWDYKGPLAMLQQRGQVDSIGMMLDLTMKAKGIDEGAGISLEIGEMLRTAGDSLGLPLGVMRSREAVDADRKKLADRAQEAHDAEMANAAATSLRDGGQGISSLMGAGPGGGQGGAPVGGAPGSPLAGAAPAMAA